MKNKILLQVWCSDHVVSHWGDNIIAMFQQMSVTRSPKSRHWPSALCLRSVLDSVICVILESLTQHHQRYVGPVIGKITDI